MYCISTTLILGAFRKANTDLGPLSFVCNNAGIIDEHNWRRCVDINLVNNIYVNIFNYTGMNSVHIHVFVKHIKLF